MPQNQDKDLQQLENGDLGFKITRLFKTDEFSLDEFVQCGLDL